MNDPENPPNSDEHIEYRAWLPIFLLVASGYVLGAAFPDAVIVGSGVSWLVRKLGSFGGLLAFGLLFYGGEKRLHNLLRDVRDGTTIGPSKADALFVLLAYLVPAIFAVCFIAALGFGAGYLAHSWGLTRYLSWGIGIFVFVGVLGFLLTEGGSRR